MAGGRKLMRLRVFTSEQCQKLRQRGITTAEEFLSATVLDLMTSLSLSYWQLLPLTKATSHAVAPTPTNVLTLYKDSQGISGVGVGRGLIPTSLSDLDAALHGGLPPGTLTEIVGGPGCGKTQLCLTIAMTTALPPACSGCGLGVVFIDTEATFSATRLVEMAKARHPAHFSDPHSVSQLASRVRVHRTLTSGELEKVLASLEEEMGAWQGVGLVVVDSVAGPVRREFGTRDGREMAERAATLGGFTSRLKYIAEVFHVSVSSGNNSMQRVLVTNQVTAVSGGGGVSHDTQRESDWSASVTAALGNTWAHCVNIRLFLNHLTSSQRMLVVEKSPVSANKRFMVQINKRGVVMDSSTTPNTKL